MESETLEDRQDEGGRLARPRLGGGKDIAALEDEGDGLDLDRRRFGVTLLGDGAQEVG